MPAKFALLLRFPERILTRLYTDAFLRPGRGTQVLSRSEERLRELVEQASDGIFVADLDGRYTDVNRAGCQMLGFSREQIIGRTIVDFIPAADVARLQEIKLLLMRGGEHVGEWELLRNDGRWLPVEVSAKILPDGRWQGIVRDISERRRQQREQRFLAEVGAALATSLDSEETLTNVAELVVRHFADCCIVDLLQEDGRPTRFKVLHRDPENSVCRRLEQIRPDRPTFVRPVLETGQPVLHAEVTHDLLCSIAQNEEHLALLREIGPRSGMVVPLQARGHMLGALGFISSSQRYDERDLAFAMEVARRAAFALDNARLYEVARQATEARDDVLAVVAHDLRSPINAIHLAAEIMERFPDDPAALRRSTEAILRSSERAIRLIQDLLDVRRIEVGKMVVECAAVAPAAVMSEAIEEQQLLASAASLDLRLDHPPALPEVWADGDRLLQLFENLIGNAMKFTPPGRSITLGAAPEAAQVHFWVRDTGLGMSPEELPNIFDRFWQARRTARFGVGLGLAIVKGIVEAHGGRIWVESELGVGTTFHFTIPNATAAQRRTPAPAVPNTRPIRALVVDDDRQALAALSLILRDEDIEVVAADCARQAMAKLELFTPDVVVTDIRLPDDDGLQLAQEIRRRLPGISVIVMTGVEGARDVVPPDMGCVPKPVDIDALVSAIREVKHGEADGTRRRR